MGRKQTRKEGKKKKKPDDEDIAKKNIKLKLKYWKPEDKTERKKEDKELKETEN